MNPRKICLCGAVWFLVAGQARADTLNDVLLYPGSWTQLCYVRSVGPEEFPLYTLAYQRSFKLSDANLAQLRAERTGVVSEIIQRLEQNDFAPHRDAAGESAKAQGFPSRTTSDKGLLFTIILELKAVETLPHLLKLEADLNDRLATGAITRRGSSPPPADFVAAGGPGDRTHITQHEFLSVMAALLRYERYQPLLDSQIEARYLEFIKTKSQGPELSAIKTPADMPADQAKWIAMDPIHGIPVNLGRIEGSMPYTPELRLQIRQFVSDYLKQKPAAQNVVAHTGTK